MSKVLKVGVLGAGRWADMAHLPGYAACPSTEVVAICDPQENLAQSLAKKYGIPQVLTDHRQLLARGDIDLVDVCTPVRTHQALAQAAVEAGKHVLCEKPLVPDYRAAAQLYRQAKAQGVRTKLGFTFRYSPGMMFLKALVDAGELGEIFHVHGLEQNSQWLDPQVPLRQVGPDADQSQLRPASVVGYGSHLVDLVRWIVGDFTRVVGHLQNFVPERVYRDTGQLTRANIDDGAVFLGRFASGAQGIFQTSYIAVGNYPGVEVRVYGSRGAAVCRLVEENGIAETFQWAAPERVEFRDRPVPLGFFPPGGSLRDPWPALYYRNLVRSFAGEILENRPESCTFYDGAKSQEIVDAVILSWRQDRWVDLPLEGAEP